MRYPWLLHSKELPIVNLPSLSKALSPGMHAVFMIMVASCDATF